MATNQEEKVPGQQREGDEVGAAGPSPEVFSLAAEAGSAKNREENVPGQQREGGEAVGAAGPFSEAFVPFANAGRAW